MASGFPKLPGYVPTQDLKTHFKKVSHVKQQTNRHLSNIEPTYYPLPRERPLAQVDQTRMFNPDYISTTHDHFRPQGGDTVPLYQPDWVRLDRHVLRFYGYFKQSVVESNLENYRIRKVIVYFYLEDNSISINEQKQQNSGIPQGILLKREKAVNKNGKFYVPQDFRVGDVVEIYGKMIRLVNCDEYTREFYEKLGVPQGPAQDYQEDAWEKKTTTKWVPQKDAAMKEYLEKKLGGGKVLSQKQFLQNDRKVLKFYATSEDCDFIVHFFLADDTIEVREINPPNSGKDPFPVTFRRQKLPFKFALNQPGQTYAQDFLRADQLEVGKSVEVFGKTYFLVDCDAFTREYYANKYHKVFPKLAQTNQKEERASNITIPPHNGIGSQEDSLGYVYRLIPKPPKKDFFKWVDQQICLRFTARFNTNKPEDVNRSFIITYYLNDDSLQIYEPPVRNSGINEGKFLQRNQYKNMEKGGRIFSPEDLIIGCDIKVNGHSFHIMDCDLFTKKWYTDNTIRVPIEKEQSK